MLLENAARTTGLSVADLETMAEWSTPIEPLVDKALQAQSADPAAAANLRNNLAGFIHGVATYLRIRAWAPSRSETILSDVPPSPHLKHLLD